MQCVQSMQKTHTQLLPTTRITTYIHTVYGTWSGGTVSMQRGVSGAALVGRSCVHCLRTNENSPNPELSESNNEPQNFFALLVLTVNNLSDFPNNVLSDQF